MTETKQPEQTSDPIAARRDADLVQRLREGDQRAFLELFQEWHPSMVRVALNYVRGRAVAEEVAQEAWLHFMQQIGRFAGRSSLKTWTFRILVNRAINRGKREHRAASLVRDARAIATPAEIPNAGASRGSARLADSPWASGGKRASNPEKKLLNAEARAHLEEAIRALPDKQKLVLSLRDIQGWLSTEVCELLEISPENQRVILHRARVRVREALVDYLKKR